MVLIGLLSPALGAAANPAPLRDHLLEALAQTKAPGAVWGVHVVNLSSGGVVFSANPNRLLVPASCTKLFTTSLALSRLGADFRVVTPLCSDGVLKADGTFQGNLVWVGRGATDLGERRSGSAALALAPFVDAVVQAGIRRIDGAVVADESRFRTRPFGPGWNWDDLVEGYGAAVSSLTFNDNVVRAVIRPGEAGGPALAQVDPWPDVFRVINRSRTVGSEVPMGLRFDRLPGSAELWVSGTMPLGHAPHEEPLAVPDPARVAALALQNGLKLRGIFVNRPAKVLRWFDAAESGGATKPGNGVRWIGAVTSAPLSELVRDCLKPSQNLHAQLLLLQVGAEIEEHPRPGESAAETTDATALAAMGRWLLSVGLTREEFALEEGSGLSRKNLATAAGTVRLLRYMDSQADPAIRQAWLEALPISGVDGTLKTRFTHEPGLRHIQAKTGTLRHVHSLAGYLTTLGGDRLAFAIYLNGYVPSDAKASGRAEVDRLAEILAGYSGKL